MRICHGVAGHVVYIDEAEIQWKKPIDLAKQHALERWDMSASDLIVLSSGGGAVGPESSADSLGKDRDIFIFLISTLNPGSEVVAEPLALSEPSDEAGEAANAASTEDELLRLRARCTDPAFEVFRSNIEEAHRWLLESRPVNALAAQAAARLEVQRLASKAVLDNLVSYRTKCTRCISLFLQKYSKVQERFDQNLADIEPSMNALALVNLHPSIRAPGRSVLADLVPVDRIQHFAANLQAERKRLVGRVEKLRKQDEFVQSLCEQAKDHMLQFSHEDSVETVAEKIRGEHARAETELLPALRNIVPCEGAVPTAVIDEEKRSAAALEGLARLCGNIRAQRLPELQAHWEQRHSLFLQRLREVAYSQTKVRDVERQAALLEEEINVQRKYSEQLGHLKKLPRAYQKMLHEVARRRQFHDRYLAEREQARLRLARMAEEENSRRRTFLQHHGCHLPQELAHGLGSLVPPVTVDVAGFDTQLPNIDFNSMLDSSSGNSLPPGQSMETSSGNSPPRPKQAAPSPGNSLPGRAEAPGISRDRTSSTSSCGSSTLKALGSANNAASAQFASTSQGQATSSSQGGSSGQAGTGSSGNAGSSQEHGSFGAIGSSQSSQEKSATAGGPPAISGHATVAGTGSGAESLDKSTEAVEAPSRSLHAQNRELSAQVVSLKAQVASLKEELSRQRATLLTSGGAQVASLV